MLFIMRLKLIRPFTFLDKKKVILALLLTSLSFHQGNFEYGIQLKIIIQSPSKKI